MPLDVTPARADQIGPIARLAALTFPLACPPDLPAAAVRGFIADQLTEDRFAHYLSEPGYGVTVALDDDQVVAYALCVDGTTMDEEAGASVRSRPTRGISKFYLHPDHHGSGIATALLEHLTGQAIADGCGSLWLATNKQNVRALRFYRRRGFTIVGGRTFLVGGVENDDDVLELSLAAQQQNPLVDDTTAVG